jgi:7-cyano-7-deazaguanine synthase
MTTTPRAVVLLSGGVDSTTVLAIAQDQGHTVHTLAFDYGQRHRVELDAARRIAETRRVADHRTVRVDLAQFGGSALTDRTIPIPATPSTGIPATYVPARNTIFLAHALAYAEVVGAATIWIGCNADDEAGYPDCRAAYLRAFEAMAQLATAVGVADQPIRIVAPLLGLTKPEIITWGAHLGVDYTTTWSCYNPTHGQPCQTCDACRLRSDTLSGVA